MKHIFLSLFFLFTVTAYGQDNPLAAISGAVKSMPAFKAEFTISTPTTYGTVVSYSGNMTVKGGSYILTIPQMHIYSDGETTWYYTPERDEVVIENAEGNEEAFGSPISLLTLSDADFRVENSGDGFFTAVPLDKELAASVEKVEMYYDVNTLLPRIVRLFSADGSHMDFRIDTIAPVEISDTSIFTFDVSKVKEVIDFR